MYIRIGKVEKNDKKYSDVLQEENKRLKNAQKIFIYGAGNVGKVFYVRLSKKYKIDGFVVTKKNVENQLFGIPIYEIDSLLENDSQSAFGQ